ncbi:MAG: squalene synthase HpnC [Rhodospirillaceae bacterium]|nr:squalene synthase HpnC [Rhodospirillaceae bacterium]
MGNQLSDNKGIETPSGKNIKTENFPVASYLIAKALRKPIVAFYQFARAGDDIADNPQLSAEEKIKRLDFFEKLLYNPDYSGAGPAAANFGSVIRQFKIDPTHAVNLLTAFRQDAVKSRYQNWEELINYCNHSAAPVGRFLLDLHQENRVNYIFSDALCNALQLINHLQDCQDDYVTLDRVYLPLDMVSKFQFDLHDLSKKVSPPAFLKLLHSYLDKVEELLDIAKRLPGGLKNRRLALESAVIIELACAITQLLRRQDVLKSHVKLSKSASMVLAGKAVVSYGIKLILLQMKI